MSSAQGHASVRSGMHVCQGFNSKSVPLFRSLPKVQRRNRAVPLGPEREGRQAQSQFCGRVGGGLTPGAIWWQDSRRHLQENQLRVTGSAEGPESALGLPAPESRTPGLQRRQLGAAVRPPPASGSLRTPLVGRRVLRPTQLPVVAGPYIRCPPALGSAAAMLSRSRCVSRAFSRSLSAFQKVRSGRAGASTREESVGGRTRGLEGRGAARRSDRAPRALGRGGRAGWAAGGRGCSRDRFAEPSGPLPSSGSPRETFPAVPHPPRWSWGAAPVQLLDSELGRRRGGVLWRDSAPVSSCSAKICGY